MVTVVVAGLPRLAPLAPLSVARKISALSGVLFFVADPVRYGTNPIFMVKMALIALAGINALSFERLWTGRWRHLPVGAVLPPAAKLLCAGSLLLWTAVIVTGRVLPQFSRTF